MTSIWKFWILGNCMQNRKSSLKGENAIKNFRMRINCVITYFQRFHLLNVSQVSLVLVFLTFTFLGKDNLSSTVIVENIAMAREFTIWFSEVFTFIFLPKVVVFRSALYLGLGQVSRWVHGAAEQNAWRQVIQIYFMVMKFNFLGQKFVTKSKFYKN